MTKTAFNTSLQNLILSVHRCIKCELQLLAQAELELLSIEAVSQRDYLRCSHRALFVLEENFMEMVSSFWLNS